jgi:hypothetical protein
MLSGEDMYMTGQVRNSIHSPYLRKRSIDYFFPDKKPLELISEDSS